MIQTVVTFAVITTMPLLFGAVQPVVWSLYAAALFALFAAAVWRGGRIDPGLARSPWLLFSAGVFFVYTMVQVVPLPAGLAAHLSPLRHGVTVQAAGLLGAETGWHACSYLPATAFARWIFLLGLLLFAGTLRVHLAGAGRLAALVALLLGVALLQSLYGLVQALVPTLGVLWADTAAGLGSARGTFINRNHFAGYLEMVWPLGLGLILALAHAWRRQRNAHTGRLRRLKIFLSSDHIGVQLLIWAALVFILLALLFSKSRAGITGALIGFAAFIALVHTGGKRFSWPAWTVMGLGFAFLLFYGNVIGFGEIIGRFLLIDEHGGSRANIWTDTLAIIRDHPLGIGLGNYERVMTIYNAQGSYGIRHVHAHNDYLQLLAEAGWPGFVALAGGFFLFLGRCVRRLRRYGAAMDPARFYIGIGACSGLISIAFHSLFDFNLQIPANLLYFVVLLTVAHSALWGPPAAKGATRMERA